MRLSIILIATLLSVAPFSVQAQDHAGQMDTDGILSPGERPNPNIDYDKSQRKHDEHGDARVDNPYNDSEADRDRAIKDEQREQYNWNGDEDRDEHERREEERREEQQHSWWSW